MVWSVRRYYRVLRGILGEEASFLRLVLATPIGSTVLVRWLSCVVVLRWLVLRHSVWAGPIPESCSAFYAVWTDSFAMRLDCVANCAGRTVVCVGRQWTAGPHFSRCNPQHDLWVSHHHVALRSDAIHRRPRQGTLD